MSKLARNLTLILALLLLLAPLTTHSAPNTPLRYKFDVPPPAVGFTGHGVDPAARYRYVSGAYTYPKAQASIHLNAQQADIHQAYGGPSFSWTVTIPESALYEIHISYRPAIGSSAAILRSIKINDAFPFHEAENFLLPRLYAESEPVTVNIDGDELAPRLVQLDKTLTTAVMDLQGHYTRPLQFALPAGTHTITLAYSFAEADIEAVTLVPPAHIPTYAEYRGNPRTGNFTGESIVIQAEDANYRSVSVLRRGTSGDPDVYPFRPGYILRNTIGGWQWRAAHDTLTFLVEVPESGFYRMTVNAQRQMQGSPLPSFRQIRINGAIPFEEARAIAFPDTGRRFVPMALPYLFYLNAGVNEISFTAVVGPFAPLIHSAQAISDSIGALYREITVITGAVPDVNFDYEIERNAPHIIVGLKENAANLRVLAHDLASLAGANATSDLFRALAAELESVAANPFRIPARLPAVSSVQENVAHAAQQFGDQPLTMDYIALEAPGAPYRRPTGSFWLRLRGMAAEFLRSFTRRFDAASAGGADTEGTLQVWVANTREHGELLQRLADDFFTRDTGIPVMVNQLPAGSVAAGGLSPLMLAVISGDQPDVVVGSDPTSPVELAIREAALDLTAFDRFDQVAARFLPHALDGFRFNDGVYALPLNMDMPLMFYRADILAQLGLAVPETWDELTQRTFPTLMQAQYGFVLSAGLGGGMQAANTALMNYSIFLFQNGGQLFTDDGLDIALDSDAAYRAFRQWTDLYLHFNIDVQAEIFNHFRRGSIPLAIGGIFDYARIQFAAPELTGRWGVAPVPGIPMADGSINRVAMGSVTSNILFDNGEERNAWAFEFLDWWTSSDIQIMYAHEIESIMGREARWFSANMDAFNSLSWNRQHLDVITEWTPYFRTQRNVLGGYLAARTVMTAWTEVVLNGANPRDQLERAIRDNRAEMRRKQLEYGILHHAQDTPYDDAERGANHE